jgi:ABC-type phosphate transport system permease subunit
MSITYSECVSVALVIQHAKRMRRIILSSVTCLAVPVFSHYLINDTIFGKNLLNIKCVFSISLQLSFETFLILRIIARYIIINVHRSSCKVPVILITLQKKLEFS